jgi:GT2 family glycosyltransferase
MSERSPRVSVIIPCYESHGSLTRCLEALSYQSYRDFEAIVIDSSPGDAAAPEVADRFPQFRYRHLTTRLLPHAARNLGANEARGAVLVFTDSDCLGRGDWLQRLVAVQDSGAEIVGGSVEPADADWLSRGIHWCKFGPWVAGGRDGTRSILPTANLALSRATWSAVGPFVQEGWSGDAEFSWRARAAGYELSFLPSAVVEHIHETNFTGFLRERVARGEAFGRLRTRYHGWTRARAAAYLAALPLIPIAVLALRLRDAARSGRAADALLTAPVQLAGYVAWSAGEARAHVAWIRRRPGQG